MTIKHIFAIIFIYLLGTVGWIFLGGVMEVRSSNYSYQLSQSIETLWGAPITQQPPRLTVNIPGTKKVRELVPESNRIVVDLQMEQRRKGLIWYPTYIVNFLGEYQIQNPHAITQNVRVHLPLPSSSATYDQFEYMLDGKTQNITINPEDGVYQLITLEPNETRNFSIRYQTRGLSEWRYELAGNTKRVKNLDAQIHTNFVEVDYTDGGLSPMRVTLDENGTTQLRWAAKDLITHQHIGIILPEKINPGPLSAKMTFFAPVCLLFFFILFAALSIVSKTEIHPMHYLFVTGGFFAFHLLFAYMVDLMNIHLAFVVSTLVSISLVLYYLKNALGKNFPWKVAGMGQVFYLILFSYSFFLNGKTGLVVAIGSILTLALLMKLTAKTNWGEIFAQRRKNREQAKEQAKKKSSEKQSHNKDQLNHQESEGWAP